MAFEKEPKTLSEQKGDCGEAIVLRLLLDEYPTVHNLCGRSLYDFFYKDAKGQSHYADAKARMLPLYAKKLHDCFSFNKEKLNAYISFSTEQNCPFELWVVDARDGKVYIGELSHLRKERRIYGVNFPICRLDSSGKHMVDIHCEQFDRVLTLEPDNPHLKRLRELYESPSLKAKATSIKMSDLLSMAVTFFVYAQYDGNFVVCIEAEDFLSDLENEFGTAAVIYGFAEEYDLFPEYIKAFLNGECDKATEFIRSDAIAYSRNKTYRFEWNDLWAGCYDDTYKALLLCAHMDFHTIAEAADHFLKQLSMTPMHHVCDLRRILNRIFGTPGVWLLRTSEILKKQIHDAFEERLRNRAPDWRGLTPNNLPPVVEIKGATKLVETVKTPNGESLDIVSCAGKLFVFTGQLGACWGYKINAIGGNSMGAVRAVAQIYSIRKPNKYKYNRAILFTDVYAATKKFLFDYAFEEHLDTAKKFLDFWQTNYANKEATT